MASEHEDFLTELVRHIGATLEQWEVDHNLLLTFKSEIDLGYNRTLKFELAESVPEEEREELSFKESGDE